MSQHLKREGELAVAIVLLAVVVLMLVAGLISGEVQDQYREMGPVWGVVTFGLVVGLPLLFLVKAIRDNK